MADKANRLTDENWKKWKRAFTRIRIFGGSGTAFPIGTVFELWGGLKHNENI